jgi:23S rRNA pseudouridine1911/1915/1917 synthase
VATFTIEPNERVTFKVRYEDDDVVVVNKPARIVTLPGLGHETDSLLNGLFARYGPKLQNLGKPRDFGLLHRLDKDTSGLVILALRGRAYDRLREIFEQREVGKYYWALAKGRPKGESGVIRKPILEFEGKAGKDPRTKKLARISPAGKPAVTAWRVLDAAVAASLLECRAVTGRLHQLRVHLDSIGCPILGDDLYGPASVRSVAPRLALHAHRVTFPHPETGAKIDVEAPWPADLKGVLKRLGLKRPDIQAAGTTTDNRSGPAREESDDDGE